MSITDGDEGSGFKAAVKVDGDGITSEVGWGGEEVVSTLSQVDGGGKRELV